MHTSSFQNHALRALAIAVFLATTAHLGAQGVRPGSTSRGGTTGGTNRGGTGATGGNRGTGGSSSNGQRQYRSNTELGDAMIQIDPETRSVVIVTDEATHKELDKVIKTLDRPKPQVLIKVVFLEVTYNKDSDIGIEANYTFNSGTSTGATSGSTVKTTTEPGTTKTGGTTSTVTTKTITDLATAAVAGNGISAQSLFGLAASTNPYVRILADDWSATIHALSKRGKVEVLSRPSIMARNNQEAVIVVGQEVPFITNSRIDNNGNTINTIQYDNVGIILRVTPFITSENSVEMIVAPEISALTDQTVPISNTVSSPVISKRSAETVVVTPNERTIVIGGLMETQRLSSVQKIPLLGDIPYLGAAFRRTIKSNVKRELMIFLTPHIVENPDVLHKVTQKELNKSGMVEDAFTEKEFNQFFDGSLSTRGEMLPDATPDKQVIVLKRPSPSAAVLTPMPAAAKPKEATSRKPANPKTFAR